MKYINALNTIQGLGPKNFRILIDFFGNGEDIWNSSVDNIRKSGIKPKLAEKIFFEKSKINPDQELEKLSRENVRVISIDDSHYPNSLKEIPNAPYLLYVKTSDPDLNFNNLSMVSIVGSRRYSQYGQQAAVSIARDLARAGITVVSGMAMGIDAFAHESALKENGKTIAILGSGLDDKNIGPKINFPLSRKIIDNGALVSDYPLGIEANMYTFPARNRIMAGMTIGTVVIEAGERSGTLITANLATDFNREVFAIPGSIFSPASQGANNLIKRGAKIVTNANDILEELNLNKKQIEIKNNNFPNLSEIEKNILTKISHEPIHIDRIIKLTKLETSIALSNLTMLEIKGIIKNIGGQNYITI